MLWYQCQCCSEMVSHEGNHWIDDGTTMRCPDCGGITLVHLSAQQISQERRQGQASSEEGVDQPAAP